MSCRQATVGQQGLDGRGQCQQTQGVGHRTPALADAFGDVVMGQTEIVDELLKGRRLLQG